MQFPPCPKDTTVESRCYGGKPVFVFDDHAVALKPWAQVRAAFGQALCLLTLDYHTDTDSAFGKAAYFAEPDNYTRMLDLMIDWRAEVDHAVPATIEIAIQRLRHDEHISAAIRAGILAAAFVVSIAGDPPTHSQEYMKARSEGHRRLPTRPHHYAVPDDRIFRLNTQTELSDHPNRAIESRLLGKVLAEADDMLACMGEGPLLAQPYILDIDLDYFRTQQALEPRYFLRFHHLLRKAHAITIAREPKCVQLCRLDHALTVEGSMARLEQHLVNALGDRSGAD